MLHAAYWPFLSKHSCSLQEVGLFVCISYSCELHESMKFVARDENLWRGHHVQSMCSYKITLRFRCWPKTRSLCLWMLWSTTGSQMPQFQWLMWRMLITLHGFLPKQLFETYWAPKTCTRFSVTERAYPDPCRFPRHFTMSSQTFFQNILSLQTNLDEATTAWGIKVERVEMYVVFKGFNDHVPTFQTERVYIKRFIS